MSLPLVDSWTPACIDMYQELPRSVGPMHFCGDTLNMYISRLCNNFTQVLLLWMPS